MRGRRPPSEKTRANVKVRREFEAQAKVSLSMRHGQYAQKHVDDLLAQKIRERRFRGKGLPKHVKRGLLRRYG